jgi:hypothetical protein
VLQQLALFGRMEKARREAGLVNRRPEAITRASEMLLHRGRVEAGIDTAEEDVEIRRDDIRQRLSEGRRQLFFRRLHSICTKRMAMM